MRKGQRYLTVVVDPQRPSGLAAPGRDRKTLEQFLDLLGDERCERFELVSCDMAGWITRPVRERCPGAEICLDRFHVIKLDRRAGRDPPRGLAGLHIDEACRARRCDVDLIANCLRVGQTKTRRRLDDPEAQLADLRLQQLVKLPVEEPETRALRTELHRWDTVATSVITEIEHARTVAA